jgi:hypothetical protein
MNNVTASDLHSLVAHNSDRCVSIYMPTHASGHEGQQDAVRLKNLIAAAEEELVKMGMPRAEAPEFLAPISELPRHIEWVRRKSGLAIFCSNNQLTHYWLTVPFRERLVVGEQFYIKPLFPAVSPDVQFFVLAISRNQVRLIKATSHGHVGVDVPGLPSSMEQGLNLQTADRGEQVHSGGTRGNLGKEAAVFHGQGGHPDTLKDEFVEYSQLINKALQPILRESTWPLILAGVDVEIPIVRKELDYPHTTRQVLHGSFDYFKDGQLYDRALQIAQHYYGTIRQKALNKYRTLSDRTLASEDINEILPAAYEGKIDTLFVNCDAEVFGRYISDHKTIEVVESRDPAFDLVEAAAIQTIRHGGTVYAATPDELPRQVSMCALRRYW